MSGAPVVVQDLVVPLLWWGGWVVVQKASLGSRRCADNVLEVTWLVAVDLLFSILVTCLGNKDTSVDDETAEILECLLETREDILRRPHVGRKVLWEVLKVELGGWNCTVELRIDVESTVGIVRTFEGIDLAILKSLLSKRPSSEVFSRWVLQLVYARSIS